MYRHMFNIFEEITWLQFTKYPRIAKLPLNEQVQYYNQYLQDLSVARLNWVTYQNKGTVEQYLAQEEFDINSGDYYLILQEDGSKIIIT
jgi:hypothetical protein